MLHNSDNNRNNQSPLVIPNEYGSNLNLVEEVGGYESFLRFYEDTGLNLAEVLAEGPSAPKWILTRNLYQARVYTTQRN